MNINYNEIIGFLDSNVYKKSPRFIQIKQKYDEVVSQYGFSTDYDDADCLKMNKIISMLEEEGRFCKNYMGSDVLDDFDYWMNKQSLLSTEFIELVNDRIGIRETKVEKVIKKEKEVVKKVQNSTVDMVSLLGYSSGAGITRLLNSCTSSNKDTFLRMKPYNVVEKELATSMLEAIVDIAPKDKKNIIKKALEVLNEQ